MRLRRGGSAKNVNPDSTPPPAATRLSQSNIPVSHDAAKCIRWSTAAGVMTSRIQDHGAFRWQEGDPTGTETQFNLTREEFDFLPHRPDTRSGMLDLVAFRSGGRGCGLRCGPGSKRGYTPNSLIR